MKKKYFIQIKQAITVECIIKSESMEDALKVATDIAENDQLIKPRSKAWNDLGYLESHVVGVLDCE
jgi:hypothetical protein